MGLLRTTIETHYHLSKEAAKEQRKAAEEQRKAAEAQADSEYWTAVAEGEAKVKAAKEQRKAEVNVAKQHRKEIESQLKHEKEMRLLQEDPEAYKAYLEREHQEKTNKRNLIKNGVLIYIAIVFVVLILLVIMTLGLR